MPSAISGRKERRVTVDKVEANGKNNVGTSSGTSAGTRQCREHIIGWLEHDFNQRSQPLTEGALLSLNHDNELKCFDIPDWFRNTGNLPSAMHMLEAQEANVKAKASAVSTTRTIHCPSRVADAERGHPGQAGGDDPLFPGRRPSASDGTAAFVCGAGSKFSELAAPMLRATEMTEVDLVDDEIDLRK